MGPPLGGVVVLAHECEKIIDPSMNATGIAGHKYDNTFFIICFIPLQFLSDNLLYTFDLMYLPDQIFKIVHIVYI